MDNFKRDIWAANLLQALENFHVFASVANRNYNGDIRQKGDRVRINQIGSVNVSNYSDADITIQDLESAQTEIVADQDKYFAFDLDTLEFQRDEAQIMTEGMRKAGYAINDAIDTWFAAMYDQAGIAKNTNASPVDMTSLNVEDEFLGMAELFAEAGVPREAPKFAIIPPWVTTKLTLAGLSTKTDNSALYARGYQFSALGWDFLESQNVSKNSASWDKTRIICGVYGESFSFADGIETIEMTQRELRVGKTLVKGRYVYGGKVLLPDRTGVLYADKTAEA